MEKQLFIYTCTLRLDSGETLCGGVVGSHISWGVLSGDASSVRRWGEQDQAEGEADPQHCCS